MNKILKGMLVTFGYVIMSLGISIVWNTFFSDNYATVLWVLLLVGIFNIVIIAILYNGTEY